MAGGEDGWEGAERTEAVWRQACRLARMDAGEVARLARRGAPAVRPWIEAAARYGSRRAQTLLGQMLLDGTGGPPDPAAALAWFCCAARSGSAEAMNMVGRCLEHGWGAPPDPAAAAGWYERAAQAGCPWGDHNLANLRFEGIGVPRDRPAAVAGWGRAAQKGHGRAMNLLARCLEEGWGCARDLDAARLWRRRAAQTGYFRAEYNLGDLLASEGRVEEAIPWLRSALAKAPTASRENLRRLLARHGDPRIAALAALPQTVAA